MNYLSWWCCENTIRKKIPPRLEFKMESYIMKLKKIISSPFPHPYNNKQLRLNKMQVVGENPGQILWQNKLVTVIKSLHHRYFPVSLFYLSKKLLFRNIWYNVHKIIYWFMGKMIQVASWLNIIYLRYSTSSTFFMQSQPISYLLPLKILESNYFSFTLYFLSVFWAQVVVLLSNCTCSFFLQVFNKKLKKKKDPIKPHLG